MSPSGAPPIRPQPVASRLTVGGLDVHALSWGDVPPGTVGELLLLHGLGGSATLWGALAPRLHARDGRGVTAIDLAGFGRTRARPSRAVLASSTALVSELLEIHGPRVIVGSSMGAAIAVRVAATSPRSVLGLTLIGAAMPQLVISGVQPTLVRNGLVSLPIVGPFLATLYRDLLSPSELVADRFRASRVNIDALSPALVAELVALAAERRGYDEGPAAYSDAARTLFFYVLNPLGMMRDVESLEAPTLLIHGDNDPLVPVVLARALHARRPDWTLRVLDGAGHLPHLDHADRVAAAIGAWQGQRA